jgi:hypothetical protein
VQVSREIEIHASLLHPNVVRLYAAFEDADGIYLVQEYASRGEWALERGRSACWWQQTQASWLAGAGARPACRHSQRRPPSDALPPWRLPPRPASRPCLPASLTGDLYVELSRRGGYMPEAHVVKNVLIPFLSALTYMHTQVEAGRRICFSMGSIR